MSIISISGKKGSGKDTVGKIMQIMIDMPHMTDEAVITFIKRPFPQPTYEIEKFAEPLKQAAAIMMGCKREDLEDEDFKNTPLGPEWWYWKENITGKIYPYKGEEVNDYLLVKTTPRLFLQLLGTECGREILHPQIWVNALMGKYKPGSKWIITDTRFPNELDAVLKRDCITIRVNRFFYSVNENGDHVWTDKEDKTGHVNVCNHERYSKEESKKVFMQSLKQYTHESETALDHIEDWNEDIDNDGSILDLVRECRNILTFYNIIN